MTIELAKMNPETKQVIDINMLGKHDSNATIIQNILNEHETNFQMISDFLLNLVDHNIYSSNKDGNFYTTVEYKRTNDSTLYLKSILSNKDANGNFQTCHVEYYDNSGTNIKRTQTWTLTYDSNGFAISKVLTKGGGGIINIDSILRNHNIGGSVSSTVPTPTPAKQGGEYGINWNKSNNTICRLGNAIGLNAPNVDSNTNYINDFSNLYPWCNIKRCNLSDDGKVNAYFGEPTYKTDGSNGQCMVEIPKFYYKIVNVDSDNIEFWITDTPKDGYDLHPAFFRCRDKLCDDTTGIATEVDCRYHNTYLPYYNSTTKALESKSGVLPSVNINLTNTRSYAKARGNGWGLVDFNLHYAIQLLYLIEFASFKSTVTIGTGYGTEGRSSDYHTTGGTDNYGNNSYGRLFSEMAGYQQQMSYRGIEDLWANRYYWIDGCYCDNNRNILIGNKGFNDIGVGYSSYTTGLNEDSNGYISDIFGDKTTGFIPKSCNGSPTTGLYDVGGLSANCSFVVSSASAYGAFCFSPAPSSTAVVAIATSLSY